MNAEAAARVALLSSELEAAINIEDVYDELEYVRAQLKQIFNSNKAELARVANSITTDCNISVRVCAAAFFDVVVRDG